MQFNRYYVSAARLASYLKGTRVKLRVRSAEYDKNVRRKLFYSQMFKPVPYYPGPALQQIHSFPLTITPLFYPFHKTQTFCPKVYCFLV